MKKALVVFFMAAAFPVTLCGCRESPVLEQIVYEQDHEIDPEQDSVDDKNDDENRDEQLPPQEQTEDAEKQNDQKQDDAVSGNAQNTADKTYNQRYQDGADPNGESGTDHSDTTNTEGGQSAATEDTADPSGEGGGNGETPGGDEPAPSEEDVGKQVVDYRGVTITVPENVDSVTATGEAASIVEMLGGSGRLLASSESFKSNALAGRAFSDLSDVAAWWDGEGSEPISSSDFSALLAAAPQVCFEISGQNTFSEDQIAQLTAQGITYVVLPPLTSTANIKSAVTLVGTVLGDRSASGGTNAPAIASQYCSWTDNLLGRVNAKKASDKKYTLYISAWDDDAYWEIKNSYASYASGYGMAIASNKSDSIVGECLTEEGVTNNASDRAYVNPLKNNYWLHYVSGSLGREKYGVNATIDTSTGTALGSSSAFPAVIVSDASIKEKMQSDLHWTVYGWVQNESTGVEARGFSDGQGNVIPTTIAGEYEILVNPGGLGDWADGSVESPLEAAWIACKFRGIISMDEMRSYVSDFYSTFYHLDVNTSDVLGE